MLSAVHNDSKNLLHFARKGPGKQERSTMPATAFVYQFFIYNSLYSIDWPPTIEKNDIIFHLDRTEGYKQRQFELFLRSQAQKSPFVIQSTFRSIRKIPLGESWTEVIPDPYITYEDGEEFFHKYNQLCDLIQGSEQEVGNNIGRIFSRIESCRLFVYKIRNNIFHGTKSLGQIWDHDQQQRLEVYLDFLRCLVSCFFKCYEVAKKDSGISRPEY
jgi:hypothetical protein